MLQKQNCSSCRQLSPVLNECSKLFSRFFGETLDTILVIAYALGMSSSTSPQRGHTMSGFSDTLTRCEDCRKICLCTVECTCMAHTVSGDDTALLCHDCTDKREETPEDELQGAQLCAACVLAMRNDGWTVEFNVVAHYGVCEECGVEHGMGGPASRTVFAHGHRA